VVAPGGLGGLLARFRDGPGGRDRRVDRHRPNAAVSPRNCTPVFGKDTVGALAQQSGLATYLPRPPAACSTD
jgi:uncharacterized protein YidB (DUF937 family)